MAEVVALDVCKRSGHELLAGCDDDGAEFFVCERCGAIFKEQA